MIKHLASTTAASVLLLIPIGQAATSAPAFYGDPPDDHHPWAIHDGNRPQPKVVTPGTFSSQEQPGKPPSDAIVLFDGTDLSKWESNNNGGPPKWLVVDGCVQATPTGDIRTKEQFGDCQLHVEWATAKEPKGHSQERGNSGIFLMGLVEIQVLDCYNNITYADGAAGSVYGVNPPMANPLHPPGEFQVYDIVFRRPVYRDNAVLDPGTVTVFLNGVLVQDHTTLEGGTGHMARSKPGPFPEKGPLKLQDHGNPTRFRNIWYRPLPPRSIEGGTDEPLTTEATMAKRKEIAGMIRQDADTLKSDSNPMPQLLRLMESLVYVSDDGVVQRVQTMATDYSDGLRKLTPEQLAPKKDEVKHLNSAFKYLIRFKLLPASFAPAMAVDQLVKERGWDKK